MMYLVLIICNVLMMLCCVNGAIPVMSYQSSTSQNSEYYFGNEIVKQLQITNKKFVQWYGTINSLVSDFNSTIAILNNGFKNLNDVLQHNFGNSNMNDGVILSKLENITQKLSIMEVEAAQNTTRQFQEIDGIKRTMHLLDNATKSLQTIYDNLVQNKTSLSDFQRLSGEFHEFKSTTQDHYYKLDVLGVSCRNENIQEYMYQSSLTRLEGVIQTEIARVESQIILCLSGIVAKRSPLTSKLGPHVKEAISFQKPFKTVPHVTLGISKLDTSNQHNLRIDINALDITPQGFTVDIHTWSDTVNYKVTVQWMACGK